MGQRPDAVSRRSPGESGREPDVVEARARDVRAPGEEAGPEQIRAEIEQTRAEMSETIDALQEKLDPERLKEQAKEQAQESVRQATVGRAKELVSRVGQMARGRGSSLLATITQNPLPNRVRSLVVSSSGGQAGETRLAAGRRVVVTATRRISGRPSQGRLVGIGVGSVAVTSGLGAAWLSRRRQRERKRPVRPVNRLRRTASEIGERVPRREELVQYLPDREAAGRVRGLGSALSLLILGLLLGWALRGRRRRTARVTVAVGSPGPQGANVSS